MPPPNVPKTKKCPICERRVKVISYDRGKRHVFDLHRNYIGRICGTSNESIHKKFSY